MDATEIVITVIGGIFDIIICVLIPWLIYYLHKKNENTEDEQEKEYIDELIDRAGEIIVGVVEGLDPTANKDADIESAINEVTELLNEDTKTAICIATDNHYEEYLKVKVKSAYYRRFNSNTRA